MVWSSAVTGALALASAASATAKTLPDVQTLTSTFRLSPGLVLRETQLVQGKFRPYAWIRTDGTRITFIKNGREFADAIQLTCTTELPRNFAFKDFTSGQPLETIRRTFGNQVLDEVLEEIRHYSTKRA